eukprot:TRINITY_DN1552_c0_g1_i1.p1 TRINITY_DN1552_c0_g1~~TRINITY_DN1552_c0_g1_i1.p1  ORF type:complete len:459 (-),score=96.16 TRINITY_DN1552_c0_g1_i1:37-1371(-)
MSFNSINDDVNEEERNEKNVPILIFNDERSRRKQQLSKKELLQNRKNLQLLKSKTKLFVTSNYRIGYVARCHMNTHSQLRNNDNTVQINSIKHLSFKTHTNFVSVGGNRLCFHYCSDSKTNSKKYVEWMFIPFENDEEILYCCDIWRNSLCVSSGKSGIIYLLSIQDQVLLSTLDAHFNEAIYCVRFIEISKDTLLLISVSIDGEMVIWLITETISMFCSRYKSQVLCDLMEKKKEPQILTMDVCSEDNEPVILISGQNSPIFFFSIEKINDELNGWVFRQIKTIPAVIDDEMTNLIHPSWCIDCVRFYNKDIVISKGVLEGDIIMWNWKNDFKRQKNENFIARFPYPKVSESLLEFFITDNFLFVGLPNLKDKTPNHTQIGVFSLQNLDLSGKKTQVRLPIDCFLLPKEEEYHVKCLSFCPTKNILFVGFTNNLVCTFESVFS